VERARSAEEAAGRTWTDELAEGAASGHALIWPRVAGDHDLTVSWQTTAAGAVEATVSGDHHQQAEAESVAASAEALSGDLDKLVGEVEQIDSTIAALRAEEPVLTGAAAHPVRRFYPLLVAAQGFPVNPISTELLRARVRLRGLLSGPDVAPLEGVDTVELAMLEALADTGDRACATGSPERSTPCSTGWVCGTICCASAAISRTGPSGCRSCWTRRGSRRWRRWSRRPRHEVQRAGRRHVG
jgi:hypothetical protein